MKNRFYYDRLNPVGDCYWVNRYFFDSERSSITSGYYSMEDLEFLESIDIYSDVFVL